MLFSILPITITSCGEEAKDIAPDYVIKKEVFIPLIIDLQILESHFQRNFSRVDLYRNSLDSSSNSIFEDYKTTKSDFTKSFNFYAAQPDTLFSIYEAALDSINYRINTASN